MLSSTQQFIDALEAKGIKYEINEPTQSGKDVMTVTYSGDRMPTIRCLFFFDEDCESVAIRVFDILKVPKERTAAIFLTVNALNSKFRFVKFCVHTEDSTVQAEMDASFRPKEMLTMAVATSIDALAVGVSFAFLGMGQGEILSAVGLIAATTFVFSAVGVSVGSVFGSRFKSKAELCGGVILILIGLKILLEHLGILG